MLIAFSVGNVWGADATCTLSNANIVAAGDAGTSYDTHAITDGCSQTWNAYAIKNKHSNATSTFHFLQIKKYASNTAYYLQVPEKSGYTIKSITMVVSGSSQPRTGGGNTATLYFSASNSTSATGTGVASGTGASSVTIDCSSLELATGYITAGGAVRIWGDVVVTYTPASSSCDKKVNISAGTPINGTFDLSKDGERATCDAAVEVVVTPHPEEHFEVDEVTASNGGIVSGPNGDGKYTVTYAKDYNNSSVINVTFKQKTQYTVTWNNNDDESVTTQVYEGEKPTFPSTPVSCDGSSTTFIGWSNAAWTGKSANLTGKTVHTSNATMDAVSADVTYYAVFAKVEAGEPSWSLTSIGDLTEDDIFVFADESNYALQNDGGTSDEVAAVEITVEENEITSSVPNNLKWNISGNATDGYTFYPNGSTTTWLYCNTTASSKSNDNMRVGTGNRKLFTIESGTGYVKTKDTYTARYIGRNGTTSFRGYVNTNTNPVVPKLYKYTEGGSTSDYMTTCEATTKCATPTFSPEAGTFNVAQNVTLSCGTVGATIKYTTNGDTPDADHGTVYGEAIIVDKNMIIKAYAYKDGMEDSDVAEAAYVLKPKTPVISGEAQFWGTTEVSITCATVGAAVYYKINDGAETLYENPFTIDETANIKAVAKMANWTNSEEATADFTKIVPLTIAQAIDIIDNGTTEQKQNRYVTGIVSQVDEISTEHGNATYWISVDGTTTSAQFEIYRGKDINNANFTASTDIIEGDVVVVKGNLTYYNAQSVYEMAQGSVTIERTKRVVSLALSNDGTEYPVEFTKGDPFSHEHMVVTATYNSTQFAAEAVQEYPSCTWSGYDANTPGEQEITVTYGGKEVKYNITVLGTCTNSAVITKGATEHGSFELSVEGTQCLDELPGNVTSTVLTATPDAYYYLASIIATNGTVGDIDGNSCTISNIGANTTITAVFEPIPLNPWATVYTSNVTNLSSDVDVAVVIGTENIDALKANKGSSATFTIPAGTTNLYAHLIAWNGDAANVTISGACFNESKEQAIISDVSIAGTGSTFDIDDAKVPREYFYEIILDKEVTEATLITITAASNKRFVIFGVNAVYPAEITLDPTSYAFGEVKEGLTKSQEFTITANAMCTGDLEAEIIGTDADKFEVSAIAANKVTVTFAPEVGEIGDFTAQLQVSCTNANVTANLTATGISATQPEISVDQTLVEFGSVPQGNPLASQTVAVTLSNIATGATASITGTAFDIDPLNLSVSGDITITPNTSLAPGNYSEILTISAEGATSKNVTVTMTIQDRWVVTYTSNVVLSTTNGTSASNATVVINENSYEAIKAGTGSNAGSVQILVPAHTTKLHFHAAGWRGETVRVTANESQEKSLTSDDALTGSGTTYTFQSAPQYYSVDVVDNAQPTAITIAASAGKRFVIYGVNVDTYKRDVKVGNYGTLCLKNGGVLSGATLFEIAGKDAEKIYFDEVIGNVMEAGKPYIFLPEETGDETTTITVTYNTSNVVDAGNDNGFYGTFTEIKPLAANDGNYVISNNQYIEVDDDRVTVPAHRAYIKLAQISALQTTPNLGRRRVAIGGANAPTVATGIDALNASDAPVKVLINGQLFIIRGEKMFDAKGQLVR